MARKKEGVRPKKLHPCAILVARWPIGITREEVAVLIGGDRSVTSMRLVAQEFGIGLDQVKSVWKAAGMPGGNGKYMLADIVLWKLAHDSENEKHVRPSSSFTELTRQVEYEAKVLDLEQKKQRMLELKGEVLSVAQVQADLYALITMVKEMFLSLPRSIAPMLPANVADEVTTELTKQIRHCLSALANGRVSGMDIAKVIDEVLALIKKHGPLKSAPSRNGRTA